MSNPFITKAADAEAVAELLEFALPLMESDGRIPWSKVEEHTGIKYSRGWLIVRRAWLEANHPDFLVDVPALSKAMLAKHGSEYDFNKHVVEPIAAHLRDVEALSWGEIAVRFGLPESRVRKSYRKGGVKKDLGLRIGKGGRFAYDDQALYQANMKAEGAWIPVTQKMRPTPADCLNYVPEEQPVRRQRAKKTA